MTVGLDQLSVRQRLYALGQDLADRMKGCNGKPAWLYELGRWLAEVVPMEWSRVQRAHAAVLALIDVGGADQMAVTRALGELEQAWHAVDNVPAKRRAPICRGGDGAAR